MVPNRLCRSQLSGPFIDSILLESQSSKVFELKDLGAIIGALGMDG